MLPAPDVRRPVAVPCSFAEVICMEQTEIDALNEVVLRGRVSGDPQGRELPSGSVMVSFRLVLARERTPMTAASKQVSDWVECSAWGARVRKQAETWRDGDQVEVRGALRRRYFTTGGQARTSVEVEMLGGRLVRRAQPRTRESQRAG
jgi:single-strand DNA-binding protein